MKASKTHDELRIFQTVKQMTALGPFLRYGLWVQGCDKACPGCISPEGQAMDGGYLRKVDQLVREILSVEGIEGITISGGEPYLQKEPLAHLIRSVRERKDLGVILYTGCAFADIAEEELTALCDAVIDGPYIREKNDGLSLRGSSNQKVYFMTDRYRNVLRIGTLGRRTELQRTEEGQIVLVGVPSSGGIQLAEDLRSFLSE